MPARLNLAEYVTEPRVPVLDDHRLVNKDGTTQIDEAYLRDVARNANARYERTGDATPLVVGHTRDNAPETEQPPIVGYATNFRVEKFGRDKVALYCDFHVRKDRKSVLADYPRRSVELWVGRREIDPISLLGATTPERDLGVLRYSRTDGDRLVSVNSPNEAEAMPTRYESDDSKATEEAKAGETAGKREEGDKLDMVLSELRNLAQLLAPLASALSQMGDDGDGDQDDDLLGPGGDTQMGDDQGEPEKERYSSSAGGANTTMPGVPKRQYSREADGELTRFQRQAVADRRDVAELKAKLSRMEAEKLVAELEGERVEFADKDKDIAILASLEPDARKGYADHIRKNYRRAADPTRGTGLARFARTEAEAGPKTQDEVQALIDSNPKADLDTILNQAFGTRR